MLEAVGISPEAWGTVPQWGMLLALLAVFARQIVPWRKVSVDLQTKLREELIERVDGLKDETTDLMKRLIACEKECAEHKSELRDELLGLRRQHIQEQLAFARAVIDSVPDAPQLKLLLKALETGERSLFLVEHPLSDAREK